MKHERVLSTTQESMWSKTEYDQLKKTWPFVKPEQQFKAPLCCSLCANEESLLISNKQQLCIGIFYLFVSLYVCLSVSANMVSKISSEIVEIPETATANFEIEALTWWS